MSRSKTLTFKFQKLNNRFMGKCCTEPQEQGDSADLCCGWLSPPTLCKPDAPPTAWTSVLWEIFSIASDGPPHTGKELRSGLPVLHPTEEEDWLPLSPHGDSTSIPPTPHLRQNCPWLQLPWWDLNNTLKMAVLNWGWFLPYWWNLAMSGDILGCYNWRWGQGLATGI